jgi:hypothetical protein
MGVRVSITANLNNPNMRNDGHGLLKRQRGPRPGEITKGLQLGGHGQFAVNRDPGNTFEVVSIGFYSVPELASMEMTEEQVRGKFGGVVFGRASFSENARGHIADQKNRMLKLLTGSKGGKILRVHIAGESPSTCDSRPCIMRIPIGRLIFKRKYLPTLADELASWVIRGAREDENALRKIPLWEVLGFAGEYLEELIERGAALRGITAFALL